MGKMKPIDIPLARMRVAGYARVSSGHQEKGHSLDAQTRHIRRYCELRELDLIHLYRDVQSAKNMDRPGFIAMMQSLERGELDGIVALKLDRITRSTADASRLFAQFKERSWCLYIIQESIDTSTAMGTAVAQISTVFSELERKLIGERTKVGIEQAKIDGAFVGSPPFGWYRSEELDPRGRKILKPRIEEQNVLELIKKMKKNGLSQREICRRLNRDGIKSKRGCRWLQPQLSRIWKDLDRLTDTSKPLRNPPVRIV